MDAPVKCTAPATYQRRHPELTLWYRIVQAYLETWLAISKAQFDDSPPAYVIQAFRRYLECGSNRQLLFSFASSPACGGGLRWGHLAFGFARARCKNCGHDFLVAFSCKGRGVIG